MKERELIVKLHSEGKTQQDIAAILGISQSKVSFWIVRYRQEGCLENKLRSGRPSNFSVEKLVQLKHKLSKKVASRGLKYSSYTTKELRDFIAKEFRVRVSLRHTRRLLHRLGFSLITPRTQHIKNDPEIVRQFREEFKKNSKTSFWIINL